MVSGCRRRGSSPRRRWRNRWWRGGLCWCSRRRGRRSWRRRGRRARGQAQVLALEYLVDVLQVILARDRLGGQAGIHGRDLRQGLPGPYDVDGWPLGVLGLVHLRLALKHEIRRHEGYVGGKRRWRQHADLFRLVRHCCMVEGQVQLEQIGIQWRQLAEVISLRVQHMLATLDLYRLVSNGLLDDVTQLGLGRLAQFDDLARRVAFVLADGSHHVVELLFAQFAHDVVGRNAVALADKGDISGGVVFVGWRVAVHHFADGALAIDLAHQFHALALAGGAVLEDQEHAFRIGGALGIADHVVHDALARLGHVAGVVHAPRKGAADIQRLGPVFIEIMHRFLFTVIDGTNEHHLPATPKNSFFKASFACWNGTFARTTSSRSNIGTSVSPLNLYSLNCTAPFFSRSAGVVPVRSASTAYSCPPSL